MGLLDRVRGVLRVAVGAPEPQDAVADAVPPPPVEPAGESAEELETYTVRLGDTLAEIGARHGVPREEIARLNGIDPDLIFPRQVLRIPRS